MEPTWLFLGIGTTGNLVKETLEKLKASNLSISHYDMRYVKPIDKDALHAISNKFDKIIIIEGGIIMGGFGSAVLEFMSDHSYSVEAKRLGVSDRFMEHGIQQELYKECGYDTQSILQAIRSMVKSEIIF